MAPASSCKDKRALENITVPLGVDVVHARESLRWPPHLERTEIVRRLIEIRDFGLLDASAFFAGVETMSPAQIAAAVIAALAWVQKNGANEPLSHQLQILALNLKNLR